MNVLLTRRFRFSASHRYWVPNWSEEKNRQTFGPTIRDHGHNYTVFVTLSGPVDPVTGMVVNLSDVRRWVDPVIEELDHRRLDQDIPYFREHLPTTENIAKYLWERIAPLLPEGLTLAGIRVVEGEDLMAGIGSPSFTDLSGGAGLATHLRPDLFVLGRRYRFSASHAMRVKAWNEEKNRQVYGKCSRPGGHGHDYVLEVYVTGEPDPVTGRVVDVLRMDQAVGAVLDQVDHRRLDRDVPFFQDRVASSENLLLFFYERLSQTLSRLAGLRLWETENNVVELWNR